MKKNVLSKFLFSILCAAMLFLPVTASTAAGSYPQKPIKVIIPFNAGGSTDTLARALFKYVELPQPVVVVNMAGAASSIGTMEAYHSAPDGYTILSHSPDAMTSYCLTGAIPVPAYKDMIPIATTAIDGSVISVRSDSRFKTIGELMDYIKANPKKIKWGTVGSGGGNFITTSIIKEATGMDITYVPFDGASKSRAALLGGHVDVLLSMVSEIQALVAAGDIHPLAVATEKRSPFYPDTPTLLESGIDAVGSAGTRGYWLPPKTPADIVETLELALKKACENPEYVKHLRDDLKYEPVFMSSRETREWVTRKTPVYEKVVNKYLKKK